MKKSIREWMNRNSETQLNTSLKIFKSTADQIESALESVVPEGERENDADHPCIQSIYNKLEADIEQGKRLGRTNSFKKDAVKSGETFADYISNKLDDYYTGIDEDTKIALGQGLSAVSFIRNFAKGDHPMYDQKEDSLDTILDNADDLPTDDDDIVEMPPQNMLDAIATAGAATGVDNAAAVAAGYMSIDEINRLLPDLAKASESDYDLMPESNQVDFPEGMDVIVTTTARVATAIDENNDTGLETRLEATADAEEQLGTTGFKQTAKVVETIKEQIPNEMETVAKTGAFSDDAKSVAQDMVEEDEDMEIDIEGNDEEGT